MNKITFMSLMDVIQELEGNYGHQELWFYSGTSCTSALEVINSRREWKSPKILKRNGSIVADRLNDSNSWQLLGDYKSISTGTCASPWQSCLIDYFFKGYYIIAP